MESCMRNHEINCITECGKEKSDIQNIVNEFTLIYIKQAVCGSGLSKKEQLAVLDELIHRFKESNQ